MGRGLRRSEVDRQSEANGFASYGLPAMRAAHFREAPGLLS